MDQNFMHELIAIGILSYREQETVFQIAKRCANTAGVSMAGAGFVFGRTMGTVALPGIGTISGALAGTLAGLFAGTVSCTMLNVSMREELKKLAKESTPLAY